MRYRALRGSTRSRRGFVLPTSLLLLLFLSLLVAAVHLRLLGKIQASYDLERRLRSFVLAENGIEVMRSILPALDLEALLAGENGRFENGSQGAPRSPIPLAAALTRPLDEQAIVPDDGVPFGPMIPFAGGRLFGSDAGHTLVRVSNNPEEPADRDQDGIVLVRSLGVVQARPLYLLPQIVNAASLIEARFRIEKTFSPPAAVTLLGEEAAIDLDATEVRIDGGARPAVAVLAKGGNDLFSQISGVLDPVRDSLFSEQIAVMDLTQHFKTTPGLAVLFDDDYWSHVLQELPHFSIDAGPQSLTWLPEGGLLKQGHTGLLVSGGPLRLGVGTRTAGLVLQLGSGAVVLERGASLRGGLWLIDSGAAGGASGEPLQLSLGPGTEIVYDQSLWERALWLLPPTQLGWRVISTGME